MRFARYAGPATFGATFAISAGMNLKRWWKQVVARWLALAEADYRRAQQTHDLTERARRRYRWARSQLEQAEAEALAIEAETTR